MSERREGWYWIMLDEGWEAAYWNGFSWVVIGSDLTASTDNLRKIGPRIPAPGEPWQCVPANMTLDMWVRISGNFAPYEMDFDCFTDVYGDLLAAAPKPEDAE